MPVPINELRFGDFDGDGKTDMFYTRDTQWHVWYGRDRLCTDTESSGDPVSDLLFGAFDGKKGTDVASVRNAGWSVVFERLHTPVGEDERQAHELLRHVGRRRL